MDLPHKETMAWEGDLDTWHGRDQYNYIVILHTNESIQYSTMRP